MLKPRHRAEPQPRRSKWNITRVRHTNRVIRTDLKQESATFHQKLEERLDKELPEAEVRVTSHGNSGGHRFEIELFFADREIAVLQVDLMKSTQRKDRARGQSPKIEAVVNVIQGRVNRGIMRHFESANEDELRPNVKWNVALMQAVIAAAYEARADRVLLRDARTTKDYKNPQVNDDPRDGLPVPPRWVLRRPAEGDKLFQVRRSMRTLYDSTAHECGLNEKEGDYFVRDFSPTIYKEPVFKKKKKKKVE